MTAFPLVERPALAATLAALTDRPLGHWVAELRSPAWRGTMELGPVGAQLLMFDDPGRNIVTPRWRFWSILPASKAVLGRNPDGSVRYDERGEHALTPDEGTDALIARGVLPLDAGDDPGRAFACVECQGSGQVGAIVGGGRGQCPLCAEDCPTCGGVGKVAGVVCEACGGETIVTDDRSPGAHPRPRTFEALVAWSALGPDTILRAETLARDAARAEREAWRALEREDMVKLRAPSPRVTWRVVASLPKLLDERRARIHPNVARAPATDRARIERELAFAALFETRAVDAAVGSRFLDANLRAPMAALWAMGLALDRIDRYGVTLTVPGFAP